MPLKNAAVCAVSRARIAGFAYHRVPVDQKKGAQLPPLWTTLLASDPQDPTSTTLEPSRLWSFVLNKAKEVWVWMALCRKTRQVVASAVGDRSRQDVSTLVRGHSTSLPPRTWLHRLLGGIQGGDPTRAAYSRGKRDRRNRPRRAVEYHPAKAAGPFCAHDGVVFQVRAHARGLPAPLSSSL